MSERVEMTDEEKLANFMDSINKLSKQADTLKEKIASKNNQLPGQQEIIDADMHIKEAV